MLFTPLLQGGVSSGDTRTLVCVNTLAKRKTQPRGVGRIDWSNPITKGLVAAINPAAPDPQLIRVGTPVYVPTAYGVALKNPNDTTINGLTKTVAPMGSAATIVAYCTIPEDATTAFLVAGFASNAYPSPFGAIFAFQGSLPSAGPGGLVRAVVRTVDGGGDLSTADAGTYQAVWGTVPAVWVAVYDGTSNLTLYRNGKDITASRSSTAASGALSTIDNFSLGLLNRATNNSSGPNTQNLLGLGFNRVLSPAEIASISANPWQIFKAATKPIYVAAKSLTRRSVKLPRRRTTQPSRVTQVDWSNPINTGLSLAFVGGIPADLTRKSQLVPGGPIQTAINTVGVSYVGSATSYFTVSPPLPDSGTEFSIVALVRYAAVSEQSYFTKTNTDSNSQGQWQFEVNASSVIRLGVLDTTNTFVFGNTALTNGKIYVVAATYKNGAASLYLNGVLDGTGTLGALRQPTNPSTTLLNIFTGPGFPATGGVNFLGVWNKKALSAAEIRKVSSNVWSTFKAVDQPLYLASTPRPRSFVKVKTKPQSTQPHIYTAPSKYAKNKFIGLFLPDGHGAINVLGRSPARTNVAQVTDGIGVFGRNITGIRALMAAPKGYRCELGDYTSISGSQEMTAFAVITFTSDANGDEQPIVRMDALNWNSTFGLNLINGTSTTVNIRSIISTNGINGWTGSNDQTFTKPALGVPYLIAMTYLNGTGMSFGMGPVGGKMDWRSTTNISGTITIQGGVAATQALSLMGLSAGNSTSSPDAKLYLAGIGTKYITPIEIQDICNNPWKLFKPIDKPLYLENPPSTIVTPTSLFANLFSSANTLYTHTVSSLYTLLAGLYTNSSTLYSNTISSTRVLLADLYNNAGELYDHTVSIWQNSVINYLSNLRTKVVTAATKAIDAISITRTKILAASTKALEALSATRTKLFTTGTKSVSVTSASRTKVFTPETKSKTFTTTTRG